MKNMHLPLILLTIQDLNNVLIKIIQRLAVLLHTCALSIRRIEGN